jgi:integrase
MASISTDRNGNMRLKFYDENGKQKGFRIGKQDKRNAARLCEDVEEILVAKRTGLPLHPATATRIGRFAPSFRAKFERVGLLEPLVAERPEMGLEAFVTSYIDGRADLKPSTKDNLAQAKSALVEYFGGEASLADITPGGADEFRGWLQTKRKRPLAANTAKRLCSRAKQFFRHAQRKRLIEENPFGDMRRLAVRGNDARRRFISREVISRVMDACPSADWRLLVVLCRFGGMRPSEACNLRWANVDWERERIRVRCEKTEHNEGREWREVPFFPEIVPHLRCSWDLASDGAEMVISNHRATQNLRKPFQDIIARAGVEIWPKPFQNLRSTRQTELARDYPMHVVCSWLGNTVPVANEHYLQVTDADYRQAITARTDESLGIADSGIALQALDGRHKAGGPKSGPALVGTEGQRQHRAGSPSAAIREKSGPDAGCRSSASRSEQGNEDQSSPSRIRTYNLAVNSRSLYR